MVIAVDCVSAKIIRLTRGEASYTYLACADEQLLVTRSTVVSPPEVCVGSMDLYQLRTLSKWKVVLPASPTTYGNQIDYEVKHHPDQSPFLETVTVKPKQIPSHPALVIYPHGGPHSAFSTEWNVFAAGLALRGYIVAMVNYTGSVGFGQAGVDALLGGIGSIDVADCHYVAKTFQKEYNAQFVFVMGGSHGGFIAGHLLSSYPGFYGAGVLRNPVLNVGTNLVLSDIPDWSYLESGVKFDYEVLSYPTPPPEVYKHLWSLSPSAKYANLSRPMLFLLGKEDRRVPNYEALNWYYYLKSQGRDVTCLMFDNDCHALDSIEADRGSFVAAAAFFHRLVTMV
jgi:acylaminoacyl-peptidase